MDELGIDRALMWPTLASLVEERLRDDPDATHAVIHALNEWMHEHVDVQLRGPHLRHAGDHARRSSTKAHRGARVGHRARRQDHPRPAGAGARLPRPALVRAARVRPVLGARAGEADIVVGMHASDSGYQRYINEWEGVPGDECTPFTGGSGFAAHQPRSATGRSMDTDRRRPSATACCTRFPTLKIIPVENGSGWVRPLLHDTGARPTRFNPHLFEEDPVEVFKRNIYVHPFHEDDPVGLMRRSSAPTTCCFGSDYPHPEGMTDPITFVDDLEGLPDEDKAKVMGGNLARLMNVGVPA